MHLFDVDANPRVPESITPQERTAKILKGTNYQNGKPSPPHLRAAMETGGWNEIIPEGPVAQVNHGNMGWQ